MSLPSRIRAGSLNCVDTRGSINRRRRRVRDRPRECQRSIRIRSLCRHGQIPRQNAAQRCPLADEAHRRIPGEPFRGEQQHFARRHETPSATGHLACPTRHQQPTAPQRPPRQRSLQPTAPTSICSRPSARSSCLRWPANRLHQARRLVRRIRPQHPTARPRRRHHDRVCCPVMQTAPRSRQQCRRSNHQQPPQAPERRPSIARRPLQATRGQRNRGRKLQSHPPRRQPINARRCRAPRVVRHHAQAQQPLARRLP